MSRVFLKITEANLGLRELTARGMGGHGRSAASGYLLAQILAKLCTAHPALAKNEISFPALQSVYSPQNVILKYHTT